MRGEVSADRLRFTCNDCGLNLQVATENHSPSGVTTVGTGYGWIDDKATCYPCCGKRDAVTMATDGKIVLYWDGRRVTNWPGSLVLQPARVKSGRHNIGGTQTTVYFRGPDGTPWSGRHIGGRNQLLRCRRISERTFAR